MLLKGFIDTQVRNLVLPEENNLSPFDLKSLSIPCQCTIQIKQQICISPEPWVNQFRHLRQVDWIIAHHWDGVSGSSYWPDPQYPSLVGSRHSVCWLGDTWDVPVESWSHYDVIKWKQLLRYCPSVRGFNGSPVDSPHNGTVTWTLMSLCY